MLRKLMKRFGLDPFRPLPWHILPIALLILTGWAVLTVAWVRPFVVYPGGDWHLMLAAAAGLEQGAPYAGGQYIYPPLATWVLANFVLPLGYPVVFAGHFIAVALLRPWWLAVTTLALAPFWIDALLGNFLTFSVVAGLMALRGSSVAALVYMAVALLIPRLPLLPLAVWLIWKRPGLRPLIAALAVAAIVGNLMVGHTTEWLGVAISFSVSPDFREQWDWGPTRFVGATWLLAGVPIAAWLTWKGRVGWAGIAAAPYGPPLLLLVWELSRIGPKLAALGASSRISEELAVELPTGDPRGPGASRAQDRWG